ncbi:MAG: hypothetical protein QW137_07115, partial [Candidatus Caldarchaeum sp.]
DCRERERQSFHLSIPSLGITTAVKRLGFSVNTKLSIPSLGITTLHDSDDFEIDNEGLSIPSLGITPKTLCEVFARPARNTFQFPLSGSLCVFPVFFLFSRHFVAAFLQAINV